eukprot:TRINITY_DN75538_c0_g1_i1.p1 TRINITY_DN75538_c0_g1~~TRINITY_DN75538_c0_g1_i1.p1  ORF type:complete len:495 (-),score=97.15 TRINITY_DN75538_c0_g1_i1:112-1596(-)
MATSSEVVAEFIAFTGAGADEAQSYLEMAGGDIQQAVGLFMEMGDSGSAQQARQNSPPRNSRVAPSEDSVVAGDKTGLQGGGATADDDDNVRAPIAAFDDQIISAGPGKRQLNAAIAADSVDMDRRMSFDRDADATGGDWVCESCKNANWASRTHCHRCGKQKSGASQKAINKLFAPPGFNEPAPFYQAIEKAKAESKWILANIQGPEIFASHALNRDVWRDEMVEEMVQESFVFWQRDDKSVEGEQFTKNYRCGDNLPHICVVDPRTGRSVKSWEAKKWKEPQGAAEELVAFLDRFGMPKVSSQPPAPEKSRTPVGVAIAASPSARSGNTEANKATIGGGVRLGDGSATITVAGEAAANSIDEADARGVSGPTEDASAAIAQTTASSEKEEPLESSAPVVEEPGTDVGHLKVSFRMPSGQRVTRRFLPVHTVEQMFAVVASLVGQSIEMIDLSTQFPKQSLRDIEGGFAKTLKDAGVAGNLLLVETGKRRREV